MLASVDKFAVFAQDDSRLVGVPDLYVVESQAEGLEHELLLSRAFTLHGKYQAQGDAFGETLLIGAWDGIVCLGCNFGLNEPSRSNLLK